MPSKAAKRTARVYLYVVDRDLGFAPNPYHGVCTLATCKPRIRSAAQVGDWVVGLGGARLKATGKCLFAMRVTEKLTFNQYWFDPAYHDKKPVRNGSKKMLAGDNIYYRDPSTTWHQAPSHHSEPDGNLDAANLAHDTGSEYVLLSRHFYYFGSAAVPLPDGVLAALGYANGINHRTFAYAVADSLIKWLETNYRNSLNLVLAPPFDFNKAGKHYSVATDRIR